MERQWRRQRVDVAHGLEDILQCNVVTVIRVIVGIVATVLIDILVKIVVNVFAGKNGM